MDARQQHDLGIEAGAAVAQPAWTGPGDPNYSKDGELWLGCASISREVSKTVNKRAWALARATYERYLNEMREALRNRRLPANQIENWTPGEKV